MFKNIINLWFSTNKSLVNLITILGLINLLNPCTMDFGQIKNFLLNRTYNNLKLNSQNNKGNFRAVFAGGYTSMILNPSAFQYVEDFFREHSNSKDEELEIVLVDKDGNKETIEESYISYWFNSWPVHHQPLRSILLWLLHTKSQARFESLESQK